MRRRQLLATLAAAGATPTFAWADEPRRVPIAKAFPFLASYYGLAPEARSRFYLSYRAVRDKRPVYGFSAAIVAPGGAPTPLPVDGQGIVSHIPTQQQMKAGGDLLIATPGANLAIELRAAMTPETQIDPAQIAAALAQVNADIAKLAGALSFAAPKITTAFFPDAGAGRAVLANGQAAALPIFASPFVGPVAYFAPAALAGSK